MAIIELLGLLGVVGGASLMGRLLSRRNPPPRRPPPPAGRRCTIRGTIVPLEQVLSPIEGIRCVVAVTEIRGLDAQQIEARAILTTAADFLLRPFDRPGPIAVRAAGLWPLGEPKGDWTLLESSPKGALAEVVARSPIAPGSSLYFRESRLWPGDAVEITGLCRPEPPPPGTESSYRGATAMETLTGAGARLEVRRI